MASFSDIRPDGVGNWNGPVSGYDRAGGVWSEGTTPSTASWDHINEDVTTSAADGDTGIGLAPGAKTSIAPCWQARLSAFPSDLSNVDTITARFSTVDFGPYDNDVAHLRCRIVRESNGAILAANNGSGGYTELHTFNGTSWSPGAPGYNRTVNFAYVDTAASLTAWNDAYLQFDASDSAQKGSDNATIILVDIEFEGTYTSTVADRFHRNRLPRGNFVNSVYY